MIHFAYGSNLCLPRLRSRVPGVCLIGRARLAGHALRWHKRSSQDKSAKLNIVPSDAPDAGVHGALFRIPDNEKRLLDRAEGLNHGYDETYVTVRLDASEVIAQTYVAEASHIDDSLRPYTWYRDLVIGGAEALELDESYVAMLRSVEAIDDPEPERDARERAFLPCGESKRDSFLRNEFHRLTMVAALQRSSTYAGAVTEPARAGFRADLRASLERIAARYIEPVEDVAHEAGISELSDGLSSRHTAVLAAGRFRIGVAQKALNLFLKYLWCAGWIAMPPHCPFDGVVMRLLPARQRLRWTRLDDINEYRQLVANARLVAAGTPLAVWELTEYERLTRGSG